MKYLNRIALLGFLFLVLGFTSCKKDQSTSNPDLSNVKLLRGEVLLCGSGDFGEVSFDISCKEATRKNFDLGISLLHSFEYDEAEKAFANVLDEDPECVMAYWGIAMSNFHELWMQSGTDYLVKGSELLKIAEGLPKSEREAAYLNAIAAFYKDWKTTDRKTRVSRFEQQMEALYKKYPKDKEAAIFYSLALQAAADPLDRTYKNQLKSGKILEEIYPNSPNHPGIAHYIIHNYDYPELAHLALPTARRYAQIAPSSAHAQHMPSHIFTRLGLWEESINSNLKSTAAAVCYSQSLDSTAHWDEELHGMDYLTYAYLQLGNNAKAQEQLEYLDSFKKVFPVNFKVAYSTAAIPSRIKLENRDWKSAANLQLPDIDIDWKEFPWEISIYHFARALGAVRYGDLTKANSELDSLERMHGELKNRKDDYKATQVQIQINSIKAWLLFEKGKVEEALTLMNETVTTEENTAKHPVTPGEVIPAQELLGEMYLEAGQPVQALKVLELNLTNRPNRFNGLYLAAQAAIKAENPEKATTYFETLLSMTEASKSNRPELAIAKAYLKNRTSTGL